MRLIPTLALAACLLPLSAQEALTRFAVFAPERVIESSVRAKKVFAELEVMNKTLNEKLKGKAEEMQKLEQQIKSPSLSEEGRAKLQRDLQDGELAFKRLREDAESEFQKVQGKAMGQFNQEIGPILMELAKEQKLQMLFQYNQQLMIPVETAAVTAFSDELAKRYDKKYEGGEGEKKDKPAAKPAAKPAEKAKK